MLRSFTPNWYCLNESSLTNFKWPLSVKRKGTSGIMLNFIKSAALCQFYVKLFSFKFCFKRLKVDKKIVQILFNVFLKSYFKSNFLTKRRWSEPCAIYSRLGEGITFYIFLIFYWPFGPEFANLSLLSGGDVAWQDKLRLNDNFVTNHSDTIYIHYVAYL